MEISNRKLFSHGVVVIGLAVAAAGVFEAAAEEPKASAAAQKAVVDGETGLSQKERAARQARFAAQDEKLTAARKLYAEQKYDEATKGSGVDRRRAQGGVPSRAGEDPP